MLDGRRLRRERQRQALEVPELAALVGLDAGALSSIEEGVARAGVDDVTRLAAALGVEPHDIENDAHGATGTDISAKYH